MRNAEIAKKLDWLAAELRAKGDPAEAQGLKEVQERLERARNEVARLEQAQDRMQAEGHGVLCQCYWCRQRHEPRLDPRMTGKGMKFEDGRPA
jgi:hypothetical protein